MKKLLKALIFQCLLISSVCTAYAANTSTVDITSYIDGKEITGNVFVGETVKTVVGIENMPDFVAYELGFKYNKDVIQLAPLAETTPSDVYDFETEDVDIDLSTYSTTKLIKRRSYALPNYGAIISQRKTASTDYARPQTAVTNHTDLFTIEYKALKSGTSDFVWLNGYRDCWDVFEETDCSFDIGMENKDFCYFSDANISKEISNFTVIEKPDDPTDVEWVDGEGVYTVHWNEPLTSCRGYEVIVYVNDCQKGEPVTVTDTTYDLLAEGIIGTLTTGDMVKVSVKALGGVGSNAVETPEKEITGTPLEDITPVMGENEVITWNEVENAAQYIIEVYDNNNIKVGESITVSGDETSYDLSNIIVDGDYTIKITADGNSPLYINSTNTIKYSAGFTTVEIMFTKAKNNSLSFISKTILKNTPKIKSFGTTFIPLWLFKNSSPNVATVEYDNSLYNIESGQTFDATLSNIPNTCLDMAIVGKSFIKSADGTYIWSDAKYASVNDTNLKSAE